MNKTLQKNLLESDKKIMELEKEMQKNVSNSQQENLTKIKESSTRLKESSLKLTYLNKENAVNNGKSIERKKTGHSNNHSKKSVRVSSSSTNIQRKLQIKHTLA